MFAVCYGYQLIFILISVRKRNPRFPKAEPGRYAVLICARNEEAVIGQLIGSVRSQKYPAELVDIHIVADNCTDGTARVAREAGARVIEREDKERVGKGYALEYLIGSITESGAKWDYDGYIVIDADNLLDEHFIAEFNNAMKGGCRAVTAYRDSKNFSDNWLSASYAVWWLREARYLNGARCLLGLSAQVSGTGFAIRGDLLRELGGWHYFTLTEDVEFTFAMVARGERIGYTPYAILYDEQPTDFKQSWDQRVRWIKGYFQAYARYGARMLARVFTAHSFPCYDMLVNTLAGAVLTLGTLVFYSCAILSHALQRVPVWEPLLYLGEFIGTCYGMLFIIGLITVHTERDYIYAPKPKIMRYAFTFPMFLLTMLPMIICVPFDRNVWPRIVHTRAMDIDDVKSASGRPPREDR
ncbi:MAG: glycosyltransferase [Clostridiales Family XIII bacterium]|jgi:cellulose synthase/poly-beta-1,6-N-acetylglucosamine synthase-like glycosyltransferase|nr:glycosyltransferase [Clostridiales Family XIII bacterium]